MNLAVLVDEQRAASRDQARRAAAAGRTLRYADVCDLAQAFAGHETELEELDALAERARATKVGERA